MSGLVSIILYKYTIGYSTTVDELENSIIINPPLNEKQFVHLTFQISI